MADAAARAPRSVRMRPPRLALSWSAMRALGALLLAGVLLLLLFVLWNGDGEGSGPGTNLAPAPAERVESRTTTSALVAPDEPAPAAEPPPPTEAARAPAPAPSDTTESEGPPRLTGRLLELDRRPYADAWFHARLHRGRETLWGTMVHTDAEGRFAMRLEEHAMPPVGSTFVALGRNAGLIDRRAEVTLRSVPDPTCELGDLVLVPCDGWIRGTVTDVDGAPLLDFDGRVEVATSAGVMLDRTRVNPKGGFVIDLHDSGAVGDGLALLARADGWYQEAPVLAREAGEEVTLVLRRGGRIEGSLVPSPGLAVASVAVGARAEHTPERLCYGTIEPDGRFGIDGLDQGEHTFELRVSVMGGTEAALLEIPDVAVRWEETTRDPRLEDLNLAALLRTASLRVVDGRGAPVLDATVYVLEEDGRVLAQAGTKEQPLALVLPGDRAVDAVVLHESCRPVEIPSIAGERVVTLEPGIRVFLRSAHLIALEETSRGCLLRLRPEDGGPWPEGACDVVLPMYFGNGEELEVVFPLPGLYRLHAMTLQRMGTSLGWGRDDRYVPTDVLFDVLERDAGSQRELELPPDLLDLADPRAARR